MAKYCVIIPTHGRPSLLARAIRSVKEQSFTDVTVIVVSDERAMDSFSAARRLLSGEDIFVQRGGEPGPAPSRNMGLTLATADYVSFLDDDDELPKDFFAQADALIGNATDHVCFTNFSVVYDADSRTVTKGTPPALIDLGGKLLDEVQITNFIANSCLIYPLAAIRGKAFDPSLVLNEDWDFLLGALTARPLRHLPIDGPIIHKTDRARQDRRGAVNDHLLPEILLRIYKKRPAPTDALRAARQSFFAAKGMVLPIEYF